MSVSQSLYFVALLPDETIRQEVTAFKQTAAERFGSSHALNSPPHITLVAPFRRKEEDEPDLRAALAGAASQLTPFSVQLRNFDHFGQRVIFVDVVPGEALHQCQRVTAHVFFERVGIEPESRAFHPHMTVAFRDLSKDVFPEAWTYFSAHPYEREFAAEALTLLRHSGQRWEVIERAEMGADIDPSGSQEKNE